MRVSRFFVVLLFTTLFLNSTSFNIIHKAKKAMSVTPASVTEDEEIFWFTVSIKLDERTDQYKLMGSGSKLTKGTVAAFEKEVWYGISRRQIVVGPFQTQGEALNSRMLYKKDEEKVNYIPSEDNPEEVFWFFVTFKQLDRLGAYVFERMPAAVSSGTTTEFVDALYEGLTFKNMAVGPFWDKPNAENSKSLYRENE